MIISASPYTGSSVTGHTVVIWAVSILSVPCRLAVMHINKGQQKHMYPSHSNVHFLQNDTTSGTITHLFQENTVTNVEDNN